jgi:hypothetical protein
LFVHHAHAQPYLDQVTALWFAFLPALAVLVLIIVAQLERLRRRGHTH